MSHCLQTLITHASNTYSTTLAAFRKVFTFLFVLLKGKKVAV